MELEDPCDCIQSFFFFFSLSSLHLQQIWHSGTLLLSQLPFGGGHRSRQAKAEIVVTSLELYVQPTIALRDSAHLHPVVNVTRRTFPMSATECSWFAHALPADALNFTNGLLVKPGVLGSASPTVRTAVQSDLISE